MSYCDECKETMHPMNPEVGGYHIRLKRYFPPICEGCPHKEDHDQEKLQHSILDRIADLEATRAGRIPKQYYETLQQLQGQINFLQNKLNAALDRGKKRQESGNKQQPKTTYKGLKVGL
jgi:hypothetical protein